MKAIAAMCGNRVIGFNGGIPWKNKLDMRFFKGMTWDQSVIVGRVTYEKMGRLKNRFHYVLTDSKQGQQTQLKAANENEYKTVSEFLTLDQLTKKNVDDAWVIGGAKVYSQLLPLCSDLYMTVIPDEYEGDTYMPDFEYLFEEQKIIYEGKDMWIVHYYKDDMFSGYERANREGFDARLMGKTLDDNPYEESGHPRDTTYDDECNFQWYSGWCEAPRVIGLNDNID